MQVPTTEITGRRGATRVELAFLEQFGWLAREIKDSDVGIDFEIEVVSGGQATGRILAVQVKAGPSFFSEPSPHGWWFRFNDEHGQYWLHHSLPVIVVLVNLDTGVAYWQVISTATAIAAGETWKVEVPEAQVLDAAARSVLTRLAQEPRPSGDSALAVFEANLDHLPREASSVLRRLHASVEASDQTARRPVERLAQFLADQREAPDDACELLLDRTPAWLHQRDKESRWCGPRESEVWAAIGGYANEHGLPARAAVAYRRVADAGAQPEGHWRAVAGLFALDIDTEEAQAALESASMLDGGRVMADLGLAILSHRGKPSPVPLPPSLSPPNAADWQDHPTVRLFLGDQAARHHDHNGALEHFEAALALCPSSSTIQIKIARALLERLSTNKSPSHDADLQRVLRLAGAARAERRRWNGASDEAAEVLLQARLMLPDTDGALAVALPAPDGEATTKELVAPRLAAYAARIAYRDDRIEIGDALRARSTAASDRFAAELTAAHAAATGYTEEEQVRLWAHALEVAFDDEQRLTAIKRLSELGQWPIPALEVLKDDGAVPRDLYTEMEAKALQHNGDTDAALKVLRPLLASSAHAVMASAEVLEHDGRPDQAADVLLRGAERFGDMNLELAALDVLRRGDLVAQAETQALKILARSGLAHTVRLRVRHGLVRQAYLSKDWPGAAHHAQAALDEIAQAHPGAAERTLAELEPLAETFIWSRIGALYNLWRWDQAWAVCDRYQAQPSTRGDALMWIALAARKPWSVAAAHAVMDLYDAFADDEQVAGRALDAVETALAVVEHFDDPHYGSPWSQQPTADELAELRSRAARMTPDYQTRHPNGSLTTIIGIPDEASLASVLEADAEMNAAFHEVCQAIRNGDAALGLAATTIRRPVTQALIQRAAGMIPAGVVDPQLWQDEQSSASAALDGDVVIDLSALAVANLLPEHWDTLRAAFTDVLLPEACMQDVLQTEVAVRRLLAARFTAGLSVDGDRTETATLSSTDRAQLFNRSATLVAAAGALSVVDVSSLDGAAAVFGSGGSSSEGAAGPGMSLETDAAWAAPLEHALSEGLPLWCDDVFVRDAARRAGVPTFGTLALLKVLTDKRQMPDTSQADHGRLLAEFIVDLPLSPERLLEQARADQWRPAAAAAVLSRPAAWTSPVALDTWATITAEVMSLHPDQLALWSYLACLGAAAHDPHTARTLSKVLTIAVTAADAALAPDLLGASAAAARVHGISAADWMTAVRSELTSAIDHGLPVGLTGEEVDAALGALVQN